MVVKKLQLTRKDKNYRFYINEIHASNNNDLEMTTENKQTNNNIILTSSRDLTLKNLDVSNEIVIHNNLVLTSDLVTNDSSLVKIPFTSNNFSFKTNKELFSFLNKNNNTYDASGHGYKISFKPHSNNSKILLDFNLNIKVSEVVNQKISILVFRDNTQIVSSDIDEEKLIHNSNIGSSIVTDLITKFNLTYLDSPNTDKEITYYIKYKIDKNGTSSDLSGVGILGYDNGYNNLMMVKELFITPTDYELITNFNGGVFVSFKHNLDISFNKLDICNNLNSDKMIIKEEYTMENFEISNATFINSNDISNNIEISSNIIPLNIDSSSNIGGPGLTFKTLFCASGSIYQIDDSGNVSIMSQMNDADGKSTLQFVTIDTTYAPVEFFGGGLPFEGKNNVHRKLIANHSEGKIKTQDNDNVKGSFELLITTGSETVANQALLNRVFHPENVDKITYKDWVDLKNAWNKSQPIKIPDDLFNLNRNSDAILKKLLPEKETDLDMSINTLEICGNLIINNSDISNFKFLSKHNRIDFSNINIKTLDVTNNIDISVLDITNLTFNSNTNNTFNNLILKNHADISSIDISNTVSTNIIVDTSYLVNNNSAIFHNLTVDTIDVSSILVIINDLSSNKIIISNGDISINGTNFYSKSIDVSSISNINKITSNTTNIDNLITINDVSINNKLDISNLNILNQVKINSTTNDVLNISNNLNTNNIIFTDISGYIYGSSDFIIDPLEHDITTSAPGNVTINGNLTVNGDYTIINTNNVIYKDNDLIVLSSNGSLNNMGLTIGENNQISILYKDNNNSWNFNKKIKVVNDLSSNSINVEKLVISDGSFVGDVNNYVETLNTSWNTSQIKEDSQYIYYNDTSGINIFYNNLTKTDLLNSSLIKLELTQNSDSSSVFTYYGISKETILSFIDRSGSNINIDKSTGVISITNVLEGSFNKLTLGSAGFSGEIFNFDLNSDENNLTNLNNYVLEKDIIKYVENLNEKENNLTIQNNSTSSNDNYLSHNTFNNIEKINYSLYQNTIIKEKNINDFFSTRTLYSDNIYTFGEVKDKVYLALTNTGIYKSNNLENWKNISIDISSINCGAFNGTLWVVGGETGPNYSCSLYYSFNGEVWYKVKYSKDMIYCVNDLYYDSEKFIAVGKSYNNKAILLTSKNGIDWEYKLDNTISYNISNLANTTITNNITDFGNQVKITKDSKYIIVGDISDNGEDTQVYIYKINSDYTSNYYSNDISYSYIQTIKCDNKSGTWEYASDILCGYNDETNTNILLIKSIPATGTNTSNFSIFENNYYDNSFTFIQTITDISFVQNNRDNSGIQLSENGKYILGFDTTTSPNSIQAYRLNKNINDNSYTFINATTTGTIKSKLEPESLIHIQNLKIANNGRIFLSDVDKSDNTSGKILIYDLIDEGLDVGNIYNYKYDISNGYEHPSPSNIENVPFYASSLAITPDGKYFAYNYDTSSVRVYKEKDGSNNDWFELGSITGLSINQNSKLEIWQEQNNKDDIRIIINNDISVGIVNLDNSLNLFSIDNSGTEFSSSYNRLVIGNKSDKNVYVYNLNKEISNASDISSINSIGYDGNVYKLATDNGIYDTYDLKMLSQSDTNKANNISYDGEKWFSIYTTSSTGGGYGGSTETTNLQLLYNTNYLTNNDTSYNLTLPSSVSNVLSIANNRENYVISCVDSSNNILYYSNDLIKWNKVEDITNILGATCKNVEYDGTQFIASGSKGVAYSNDGIEWFNGNDISNILVNSVISNNVYENQIKQSRNLIIVAGDVSNGVASLAYSHEGFYWLSISGSADIFNYRANAVKCNGDKWVAVGVSNNTIAFSEDGYKWHGLGKYYLNIEGICIESGYDENDNKLWVAGGEGTYNLVYSYDGITWKDASFNNDNTLDMTKINSIKYDGSIWCAGGESDTSLSLLYSVNGKEWSKSTTSQNQMEMRIVKSIESDGYMWIAVGSRTKLENSDYIHAYSSDGKDWWFLEENINDLNDNKITKIKYVNNSWIVTTSNTTDVSGLYYSFDGFNWLKGRNLSLNSGLTDIEYCGDIYVETCSNTNADTSNSSILIDTTFEPYANLSINRNSIYPTYMVTDKSYIGKMNIDTQGKTEKIFSKTNGIGYNNNQSKKIMKSRLLATTKTGIYLTKNGLCWEQVESHTSSLNCIGYNNKDMWVYADKNKIKYSNDGYKWDSVITKSTMDYPLSIDYNGSNWLIIDGCDNSILMSNNGILWNTYDISGGNEDEKLKSITYNGTNWLIGSTHDVWYLNDSSLSNLDIIQTQIPDISLVNDIHSLGLLNLAITKQGLYQSNDTSGNNWQLINNDISYENINKICYNGIRWVVGGRNILKYSNDISNIVWKDCNMEETNFKINDIKWCGEYFVAGGKYDVKEINQNINNGLMIYSYDGINWKKVYNNNIFNEEVLSIAGSEYVKPIVNEKNIIINNVLGIEKLEKTINIDNINTSLLIKNENI